MKLKISITRKNGRSQLFCKRADGSSTHSIVGPTVPFHDIAHFVAEKQLGLKSGFYGNIAKGYSIEELSDKEVIKTLGAESWIAEIVTRALQSLSNGGCALEEFNPMIRQELEQLSISPDTIPGPEGAEAMLAEYLTLLNQWKALAEGETLQLEFAP